MLDKAHPLGGIYKAHPLGEIYSVRQVMTRGEMLITWSADNRNTNDMVGLFVIELSQTEPTEQVRQLLQPIEMRRSVNVPHVIRVHDWGVDGPYAYIVTDPPRGVTLRHVLDTEKVDLRRALDISRQILQGLKALHEHKVIGVDLRPQLITIESVDPDVHAQIDDIGLRSLLKELGYVARHRDDLGYLDPRYAAPESLESGETTRWSDLYQAGVLMFELVTGRPPFVGRNDAETKTMHRTGSVPPLPDDVPRVLQEIIHRALAKRPAERFADADALLAALHAVQLSPSSAASASAVMTPPRHGLTREMPQGDEERTMRQVPYRPAAQPHSTTSQPVLPTADGVYAYLCYEQEGAEPRRFALKQESVIVGRRDPKRHYRPDIDLNAIDPGMLVSRKHAHIHFEDGHFYIEDLKSHNGTRLRGQPLTELESGQLQHGDIVQLGSIRLTFEIAGMSGASNSQKESQ